VVAQFGPLAAQRSVLSSTNPQRGFIGPKLGDILEDLAPAGKFSANGLPGREPPVGVFGEVDRLDEVAHRLDVQASGLSTGERKRLELARALATRPRLLLLDEVTGGVDQRSLPGLVRLIQKVRGEGLTLLVIEHNLRVISAVADRLVMLHLGQKIREGLPAAVVSDPEVVQIYVGGAAARG
jgi:ABC-type branched-subunit amino acid transport system ATPase component